jgi:hypothetical protein
MASVNPLHAKDKQIDEFMRQERESQSTPIDAEEFKAAWMKDLQQELVEPVRHLLGSQLVNAELNDFKGLSDLLSLPTDTRLNLMFAILFIAAGKSGMDAVFAAARESAEKISGKPFVSSEAKRKNLETVHAKLRQLHLEREQEARNLEASGSIPDRRPDTPGDILVGWRDGKFDRSRLRRLRDNLRSLQALNHDRNQEIARLTKLIDYLDQGIRSATDVASREESRRANEKAKTERDDLIRERDHEFAPAIKRRMEVLNTAEAFLKSKGVPDSHF